MSYNNYYLKFMDELQFKSFHDPENGISIDADAVHVVGNVYVPTGNILVDEEGNQYPEKVKSEGFYVNIRSRTDLPTNITAFVYSPSEDFPIPKWSETTRKDLNLKIPKGDLMAMISVDSLANIINWMRAEGDKYAMTFNEYFKGSGQFKVHDPVFLAYMDILHSYGLITLAERDALKNIR